MISSSLLSGPITISRSLGRTLRMLSSVSRPAEVEFRSTTMYPSESCASNSFRVPVTGSSFALPFSSLGSKTVASPASRMGSSEISPI